MVIFFNQELSSSIEIELDDLCLLICANISLFSFALPTLFPYFHIDNLLRFSSIFLTGISKYSLALLISLSNLFMIGDNVNQNFIFCIKVP